MNKFRKPTSEEVHVFVSGLSPILIVFGLSGLTNTLADPITAYVGAVGASWAAMKVVQDLNRRQ